MLDAVDKAYKTYNEGRLAFRQYFATCGPNVKQNDPRMPPNPHVGALVQIAGAGKRPVLYCRDFKLGARHSTLQAQVDLGHPDVPVRIVPCGCDASIRYRRS